MAEKGDIRRKMPEWLREKLKKLKTIKKLHGREKDVIEQGDEKEEDRPDSIVRDPKKRAGFREKTSPVVGVRG